MKKSQRKTSAERQLEIIEAVLRIIGEKGVTSLTTVTIAKEVGFTSGAIFRHFTSLEEIYREVVIYGIKKIEQTFPDISLPPLERLKIFAINRIMLFNSSPGLSWLLRSEQAYLTLPKDSLNALKKITGKSRQYILDLLKEGMELKIIRSDIQAENLLITIIGTIHAMIGIPGNRIGAAFKKTEFEQALSALERMLLAPNLLNSKPPVNKSI